LEDKEAELKKEVIKSLDVTIKNRFSNSSKPRQVNFLHLSNRSITAYSSAETVTNFKYTFNVLSKLNKSINVCIGNMDESSSLTNINALVSDVDHICKSLIDSNNNSSNGFAYTLESNGRRMSNARSPSNNLCSNLFSHIDENLASKINRAQLITNDYHSTMLFDYNNIKVGVMALVDEKFYQRLIKNLYSVVENNYDNEASPLVNYVDYVTVANKLSEQLRECGAHIIVALLNMDEPSSEQRVFKEANDIQLFLAQHTDFNQLDSTIRKDKRWIIKAGAFLDYLTLISLFIDEFEPNNILGIEVINYLVK
jgi:hypothetical protein